MHLEMLGRMPLKVNAFYHALQFPRLGQIVLWVVCSIGICSGQSEGNSSKELDIFQAGKGVFKASRESVSKELELGSAIIAITDSSYHYFRNSKEVPIELNGFSGIERPSEDIALSGHDIRAFSFDYLSSLAEYTFSKFNASFLQKKIIFNQIIFEITPSKSAPEISRNCYFTTGQTHLKIS